MTFISVELEIKLAKIQKLKQQLRDDLDDYASLAKKLQYIATTGELDIRYDNILKKLQGILLNESESKVHELNKMIQEYHDIYITQQTENIKG